MLICVVWHDVAENSSPYSGVIGMVDGASPGLPLALSSSDPPSSQPASHAGSPDPAGLTVLQPSNNNSTQHYSMLPSFGYTTGLCFGFCNWRKRAYSAYIITISIFRITDKGRRVWYFLPNYDKYSEILYWTILLLSKKITRFFVFTDTSTICL